MFFFKKKSCHSNSTTSFILDHVKPNGFQCRIDQARYCPFRLSDDRWRHVRLRNRLLYNLKKWKSFNPISEKGMNRELIKLALYSSYIRILVNRQSFSSTFTPWQVLEKDLFENFGDFDDFFAYLGPEVFTVAFNPQSFMPIN